MFPYKQFKRLQLSLKTCRFQLILTHLLSDKADLRKSCRISKKCKYFSLKTVEIHIQDLKQAPVNWCSTYQQHSIWWYNTKAPLLSSSRNISRHKNEILAHPIKRYQSVQAVYDTIQTCSCIIDFEQ